MQRAGMSLAGVVGRSEMHTERLAKELNCTAIRLGQPLPAAALRMIAVSDDAIRTVAQALPPDGTPVVHVSGSSPLELLEGHAHRGVLWPIQSLSPGSPIDLSQVPLVIDADDPSFLGDLRGLAEQLSSMVVHLPYEQRKRLHLAAVIASNFPVFLLREAERLLKERQIAPQLLHPLWRSVTQKAMEDADSAVTGPARRGDQRTITSQLELLADEPDLRRAYAALSELIMHTYHSNDR